ncbi:MAG: T9SS type A sorting domain-containing protein [Saprospiraceae bacterium]|nr:MAG: T9SS type A sorting domain-containing protein [Saprospiraceae bacterium]
MGSNRVVVAILDSGTDWTHEDIGMGPDAYQNVFLNPGEDAWADPNDPASGNGIDDDGNGLVDDWKGWDFVNNNNDSRGPFFHGTHVAGIVSAKSNNNLGMASVAGGNNSPGAQLLLVGVGDNAPSGNILDDAILYAANTGASIIQLSLTVGQTADIDAAIAAANAQGVLIVCAAGNSNGPVGYPARNPAVVAVGGTNQNDGKAGFASFGVDLDISAPAVDILSTQPGDAYNTSSGTSFAAPQVSAAAALLLSRNPCLSNDQIKQIFQFSADKVGGFDYNWNANMPGHSLELGYGRLNLRAALSDQTVLDVHINQNTTFNTDMMISGNIYVHTGTQLTITSTIQFGKDKGIIVERGAKLHVNGGTLTKCPDGEDWMGIRVEGNASLPQPDAFSMPAADEAGVVLINNLAHVEWARNAISTTRYNQGWNSAYWGGMVHCENATFLSNRRVAEFMKYDKPNQSKFINCTISNGGTGVTIWDTDGINFDHCTFSNLDNSGVLVWDAGANIRNGCTFTGNKWGVQSNATSTVSSGSFLRIEKLGGASNTFHDNDWMDIELRASSLSKNVRIFNNTFSDTYDYGIWLDGRNSANIRFNTFINKDWAITGQNIGFGNTTIYCNDLSQNVELGILLENDNQRTKFLKNSFETNWLDFVLYGDEAPGSAHPDQEATSTTPAGNCFSLAHHEHIVTLAPTVSFNYHILSSDPPLCQVPQPSNFGTNLYNKVFDANPGAQDCGLDLDGDPEAEGPYVYNDYYTVKQQYLALKAQLDANPNNIQLLGETLRKEEEKEGIIAWFIRDAIAFGIMATAQTILNEEGTTESKRLLYGLKVQMNDYAGAQAVLSTLPNISQDEQWFRSVQVINLERLQSTGAFTLSGAQDSLLHVVANSKSPERSYARALLSFLKEEQFYPDIELPLGERQGSGRPQVHTNQSISLDEKVSVRPNPSNGEVEVVFDSDEIKGGVITIHSPNGEMLRKYELPESNRHVLQLADMPNGIYFLQVSNNNKIVGRTKLVISK